MISAGSNSGGQQRIDACLVGASRTNKDLDKVVANFFYTQGIAFHLCRQVLQPRADQARHQQAPGL